MPSLFRLLSANKLLSIATSHKWPSVCDVSHVAADPELQIVVACLLEFVNCPAVQRFEADCIS